MKKIAYLALIKNELQLASKIFNLLGHAFISWKDYKKALKYFEKLRDVSLMD
jgi:hypothetical protein